MNKETVPQSLGHCLGSLISSGNSNGVLGEVVCCDKDILCPHQVPKTSSPCILAQGVDFFGCLQGEQFSQPWPYDGYIFH